MSAREQCDALNAEHAELERALDEETKRPFRDSARIGELKKMKLRIKDELTRLEGASD